MLDGEKWICSDHTILNDNLYFTCGSNLIKVNLETYETKYVNDRKLNNTFFENGADYITSIDEKLYTVSWDKTCILFIDLKDMRVDKIYEDNGAKIYNLEKFKQSLFVFFRNRDYFLEIKGDIYKIHKSPLDNTSIYKSVRVDDEVWFVEKKGNFYYKFDLNKNVFTKGFFSFKLDDCIDIKYYNEKVFFLCENEIILKDKSENIMHIPLDMKIDIRSYGIIIPLKNNVFVLPGIGDDILEIDYNGKVTIYNDYPEGYHYTQPESWLEVGAKYFSYEVKNNIYYFPRRATNYMLIIDGNNECIDWISIKEPDNDEVYDYEVYNYGLTYERGKTLNRFINSL